MDNHITMLLHILKFPTKKQTDNYNITKINYKLNTVHNRFRMPVIKKVRTGQKKQGIWERCEDGF